MSVIQAQTITISEDACLGRNLDFEEEVKYATTQGYKEKHRYQHSAVGWQVEMELVQVPEATTSSCVPAEKVDIVDEPIVLKTQHSHATSMDNILLGLVHRGVSEARCRIMLRHLNNMFDELAPLADAELMFPIDCGVLGNVLQQESMNIYSKR